MTATALATTNVAVNRASYPKRRTWMAGDRVLAAASVPDYVSKTLKVQTTRRADGGVTRKLRLSSNLLPAMGYAPGTRFSADPIGPGAGIALRFEPDGSNQIHCREYASRRSKPLEAVIDLQSKLLLDAAIPAYTEAVSWGITPNGLITVTPLANRAFMIGKSLKQRRAEDRLEAFVAMTSGVDIALMEREGFRVIAALDWRPPEARDTTDKSETGALNALVNSQRLKALLNEDVYGVNWPAVRARIGSVPVLHASIQCDDYSCLKTHAARKASIEDMSSSIDMIIPTLRAVEELQVATVVIENVPGFLTSQAGQIMCLQLRRMGYHVSSAVLSGPDFGGLTSRKRAYIVASVFPGFAFPSATGRNTTPVMEILRDHLPRLRDCTDTSALKKGLEVGRARIIDQHSLTAPTIAKSQSRMAKDSVRVLTPEGRYLFVDGPASKTLMGLEMVNTELVSSEIESEIIGQSVEGPMHSALMRQVRDHILLSTGAKQFPLL